MNTQLQQANGTVKTNYDYLVRVLEPGRKTVLLYHSDAKAFLRAARAYGRLAHTRVTPQGWWHGWLDPKPQNLRKTGRPKKEV